MTDQLDAQLFAARSESARLREVLDMVDAAVVIIDRTTGTPPRIVHTNVGARRLLGPMSGDLGDLVGRVPASARVAVTNAIDAAAAPERLGAHPVGSDHWVEIVVQPLEADLHESVTIVLAPIRVAP